MKQILQNLKTGRMELAEVPCPQVQRGTLLIQTRASLISAGTERMLVEFSKANLLSKARQQPDRVKQVLDKIKTDGLVPTLQAVFRKLDEPLPLGYCNAGVVLEVGADVEDCQPGDRVVSNGPHSEVVCVPKNLCAKIPAGVSFEQATFAVPGSIALHGIRLAGPELGEKFVVFGTGLIGLLAVQLLRASGCEVMAVDVDPERLQLAESFGATTAGAANPAVAAQEWTAGKGVDGVIIAASARTDEIMHQAAEACRKRGRIVLVGTVGLNLRRSDFYRKEISFQVSCSYGPGRYDEGYEQGGQDYPYGYVRWTEQRNFEAVLGAMKAGSLKVDGLVTERYAFADAVSAYEKIRHGALGIVLEYSGKVNTSPEITVTQKASPAGGEAVVGVIGAGNFAQSILLPALSKSGARIAYIADLNAAAARHAAAKFGAERAVTDYRRVLADAHVGAVFVVVNHNLHARFVRQGVEAGKHVFVEKPLAMNEEEFAEVAEVARKNPDRLITVGFNRRFSRHTARIKDLLADRGGPLCMNMTVNAGAIPPEHWLQDPKRGGGRIVGEACHFIDLLSYVADSPVRTVSATMVGDGTAVRSDKMSIALGFADGSVGTVNYFANGSKSYPKEVLEIFSDGRVLRLENFRRTLGFGFTGFRRFRTWRQDKGHDAEIAAFITGTCKGEPPVPFERLANVTRASFAAMESARTQKTITL